MPAFQAINLEPEENIDEQIDTTKELHVDEALKRFQNALKLHAEGPKSRQAAEIAYDELFESEIFKYREARTDYYKAELQTDGKADPVALESFFSAIDLDAGGADGLAASLAQALYLSYKNHGEFFLDKFKDLYRVDPSWKKKTNLSYKGDEGNKVLDNWAVALDHDPSDPELWRRAARFAGAMNSGRIKRYCLEAAIELEDDPALGEVDPTSLAEGLAGEELKTHLQTLDDSIALSHPIILPWLRREMPPFIKKHLDPIAFLPDPTSSLTPPPSQEDDRKLLAESAVVEVETELQDLGIVDSWSTLGMELMKSMDDLQVALKICESVLNDAQLEKEATPTSDVIDNGTTAALAKVEGPEDGDATKKMDAAPSEQSEKKDGKADAQGSRSNTTKEKGTSLPNRKRSQSAAGMADGEEENAAEKRSKRIRRRETAQAEEAAEQENATAKQLRPFQEVDQTLFQMVKNNLETLGVVDKDAFATVRELLEACNIECRSAKVTSLAAQDLRTALVGFSDEVARALLSKKEQPTLGLSSFLEHTKTSSQEQNEIPAFDEAQGLRKFATKITRNNHWMTNRDVIFEWTIAMSESYSKLKWSDTMKVAVVQMLSRADTILYERIIEDLETPSQYSSKSPELESVILMLFELHIDIYERITNPSSVVDYATRTITKYRLERWLDVASAYVRSVQRPPNDPLYARFLWASVMSSSLTDNPVREHILLMWTSLREYLTTVDVEPINLPNNVVMPTVSPAAADREISKLTTMDFFLGLFQEKMEKPVHVIETLEPVLNPSSVAISSRIAQSLDESEESIDAEISIDEKPLKENASQELRDLWNFLKNSSTELRLFLWSKLGDAYEAIRYSTKRFSCYLKSIEMIVADLEGETYAKTPSESRKLLFMRSLKSLDQLLIQSLSLALNDDSVFDIMDMDHIHSSVAALTKLSTLLHTVSLCEDEVRVGISPSPGNSSTFNSFLTRLRELQVRNWCLLFTVIRYGLSQLDPKSVIAPEKDLADLLAAIHQVIGPRKFCKASNKIFLKMMRVELLALKSVENWEDYLGQVLYDLHGLKLGVGLWEMQDHGCPAEKLERAQALQLVEKVMVLANRFTMKDLSKSDLKTAIDHMQQTIGQTKSTPQMIHNLRNFIEMLKKPIHPLRLYQSLKGAVAADSVTAMTSDSELAKHGWFFLLGMMALTKFKGVDLNRRQTPGATDDLRIGATFMRLQLQFTADKWDAWFRLAECFDYELDEAVLWSADKINKDRTELVKFQRNAIHCYTLALSHSRNQDIETADGDPLHDLYHKFGMRLYSSNREPFAMEPFKHSEQERFFIEAMGASTFKKIMHEEMTEYKVWKFAAKMFRMAMERKPNYWMNPYMLAKCYWKMHQTPDDVLDRSDKAKKVGGELVLDTLKTAIDTAHKARKSRNSEPILEPHFKMASVLHKMVMYGDMSASEAALTLSLQPFGVKVGDDLTFEVPGDWDNYILKNVIKLKEKDKANWHHRMITRHALLLFEEASSTQAGDEASRAKAAFAVLRENMFTKTMVMNVWKCDAERPGRHHVYTEQYVRFVTKLLVILDDRFNLELLLRRLRKKGADFYHFTDLWQTCCVAYLKLLRKVHDLPSQTDDPFKSMSSEEFEIVSEKITDWASADGPYTAPFSCMKDAIELKKLNGGLMKAAAIDDVISDCYAKTYMDIMDSLPGLEPSQILEARRLTRETTAVPEVDTEDKQMTDSTSVPLEPAIAADVTTRTATPVEGDKLEVIPRPRKLPGVRRPDVLRKAEQAVLRSMEAPKTATTRSRKGSMSSRRRGSQPPNRTGSNVASGADDDRETDDEDGPDAQVRREAGEGMDTEMGGFEEDDRDDDQTQGDGSDLDSNDADDESDLSDVPDEFEEQAPPGLQSNDEEHEDEEHDNDEEMTEADLEGNSTHVEETTYADQTEPPSHIHEDYTVELGEDDTMDQDMDDDEDDDNNLVNDIDDEGQERPDGEESTEVETEENEDGDVDDAEGEEGLEEEGSTEAEELGADEEEDVDEDDEDDEESIEPVIEVAGSQLIADAEARNDTGEMEEDEDEDDVEEEEDDDDDEETEGEVDDEVEEEVEEEGDEEEAGEEVKEAVQTVQEVVEPPPEQEPPKTNLRRRSSKPSRAYNRR